MRSTARDPHPGISVTKTLRVHESAERYVRVIGDGTPENTKLLDLKGDPIPESVLSIVITFEAGRCARGTFTYFVGFEESDDCFEAWVILEPPLSAAPAPAVTVEEHNKLIIDFNELADRYNQLADAANAASFALKAGGIPDGHDRVVADSSVPGPSTTELVQITKKFDGHELELPNGGKPIV